MKPLVLFALIYGSILAQAADPIAIWPGDAKPSEDIAALTPYLPENGSATGAGVVVVPGGSFLIRCEDHEGTQVAKWFARHGVAAFVVHYRLIPRFTMREELDDVRRALQVVRSRASEFGIAPNRIGVIGFSAGAFLAGEAALKPWEPHPAANYLVERVSSRPDFLTLVYGAPGGTNDPLMGLNRYFAEQIGTEDWKKYTATSMDQIANAPPSFLFCTGEDRGAARRMGEFHLQLLSKGVSSEAHFFANGPHGVGFAQGDPVLGVWPDLMLSWMRAKNILTGSATLAINGTVKVNGNPLELGYLVFTPLTPRKDPVRTAYVFNRSGPKGAFQLPQNQGLTPGRYKAEVYQMATKWNSVWAEPLLNRIQARLNAGENLSESDVSAWKEWASARSYAASQSDLLKMTAIEVELTEQNAEHLELSVNGKESR
jgi:acetyl esterase/lipase